MTVGVVVGAFAACVVAWGAILGFAWMGRWGLDARPLRWFGASALALLALAIAGVPIPWSLPPVLLGLGLVFALVSPERVDA